MPSYLVPWKRFEEEGLRPQWRIPGAAGIVNLQTPAQVGTGQGYAFAAFPNPITRPDAIPISDKAALVAALGIGESIVATTPIDILWELLTQHSDPTGLVRWRPIIPTRAGNLELFLGGHTPVRRERFELGVHPASPGVLAVIRLDFQRKMAADLAIGSEHYRYVLREYTKKYGVPAELISQDSSIKLPDISDAEINDDFGRGDGDLQGSSSSESWSWSSWNGTSGDIDIVSNEIACTTGATKEERVRADSDLDSDDHYVELTVKTLVRSAGATVAGVFFRKSSASTYQFYEVFIQNDGAAYRLRLTVEDSVLAEDNDYSWSDGGKIEGDADGSTIRALVDDVQVHSVTDGTRSGETRTGVRGFTNNTNNSLTADDFKAGDKVAAAVRRIFVVS